MVFRSNFTSSVQYSGSISSDFGLPINAIQVIDHIDASFASYF